MQLSGHSPPEGMVLLFGLFIAPQSERGGVRGGGAARVHVGTACAVAVGAAPNARAQHVHIQAWQPMPLGQRFAHAAPTSCFPATCCLLQAPAKEAARGSCWGRKPFAGCADFPFSLALAPTPRTWLTYSASTPSSALRSPAAAETPSPTPPATPTTAAGGPSPAPDAASRAAELSSPLPERRMASAEHAPASHTRRLDKARAGILQVRLRHLDGRGRPPRLLQRLGEHDAEGGHNLGSHRGAVELGPVVGSGQRVQKRRVEAASLGRRCGEEEGCLVDCNITRHRKI